jgi:hypothetical protein
MRNRPGLAKLRNGNSAGMENCSPLYIKGEEPLRYQARILYQSVMILQVGLNDNANKHVSFSRLPPAHRRTHIVTLLTPPPPPKLPKPKPKPKPKPTPSPSPTPRFAPLSLGRLVDDQLVCSYHGWGFGPEGKCTNIPQVLFDRPLIQKLRKGLRLETSWTRTVYFHC